jgi:hypothetical protein
MKQTAVEWLVEQYTQGNYSWEVYEQAKKMEKEQMYDSYNEGFVYFPTIENFNEYYNETYENK